MVERDEIVSSSFYLVSELTDLFGVKEETIKDWCRAEKRGLTASTAKKFGPRSAWHIKGSAAARIYDEMYPEG